MEPQEGGVYISVEDGDVIIQVVHETSSGEWGVHTLHLDPVMAVSFSESILLAAKAAVEDSPTPELTVIKGGKSDDTIH